LAIDSQCQHHSTHRDALFRHTGLRPTKNVYNSRIRFDVCDFRRLPGRKLEARAGIEPAHKGFADLSLTTWVPRLGLPASLDTVRPIPPNDRRNFHRRDAEWSGRRDLNSRPSPWQGDALPLSYSRLTQVRVYRGAETGSNWYGRELKSQQTTQNAAIRVPYRRQRSNRRLTLSQASRTLSNCEGCGTNRLPPRIIFPENQDYPLKFRAGE
jgi:hypothetical protein